MAEIAAIPLFTDSWKADTDHLERVERDIYLCLLILMWRTPGCRVPNDLAWMSRKLQLKPDEVPILEAMLKEFCQSDGNWVTQKRLLKEFAYVQRNRRQQSDRANSRWEKEKGASRGNAAPHGSGNAPSPSPSPSVRKEQTTSVPKDKRGTRLSDDFEPDQSCIDTASQLGFDRAEAQQALDSFRDYWKAAPGAKGVKLDWQATFRNWLRNTTNRKGKPNGKARKHSADIAADELIAEIRERHVRHNGGGDQSGAEPAADVPRLRSLD